LVDKLTILLIKMSKMQEPKLANVKKEYSLLAPLLEEIGMSEEDELFRELYGINLAFWEYHDWQRERFRRCTDENLVDVELYKRNREEHVMNDDRARVKKEINRRTRSALVEEKQFASYGI